eukprot:tig00000944_g5926.t1
MTTGAAPLRVCIVGSGPAGFYTADRLLRNASVTVDMLERYPVPYGLVRFGVAPDHPEVKAVIGKFESVAEGSGGRFRFAGNVALGRDVALEELRRHYHAVVLAYGAEGDRRLGVPGEELPGVFSAREFVGWYNGLPECSALPVRLDDVETVAIVGQGNVAVDCARVLCKPVDELRQTDISEAALEALARSRVRRVLLLGRRGPVQAAWATAELRELAQVASGAPGRFRLVADPAELALSPELDEELQRGAPLAPPQLAPPRLTPRRAAPAAQVRAAAEGGGAPGAGGPELALRFLRSPVAFTAGGAGRLGGVRLERNELVREAGGGWAARGTGALEEVPCEAALRSVGYRSLPVPGVPFDARRGVVPSAGGRVEAGWLYVAGWLKRGPTGIIGSNIGDAEETAASLLADLAGRPLPPRGALEGLAAEALGARGVRAVSWEDWRRIDAAERAAGARLGRPRCKLPTVPDMLAALP